MTSDSKTDNDANNNLQIPKKTNVFLEQTVREKENAEGMFNIVL